MNPSPSSRLVKRASCLSMVTVLVAASACTGQAGDSTAEMLDVKGATGPPVLYVAVGASETVGIGADEPLREAWTQVLYRTAMPQQARFVNLGIPGATVRDALRSELPYARSLEPDVVTVWLNVNDIVAGVSPASYESDLTRLLTQLRAGGARRILVANTPPVQHLPSYRACLPDPTGGPPCLANGTLPPPREIASVVARYNEAIARAATASGATVVDLHAIGVAAVRRHSFMRFIASDGFHPSTAGHRRVAEAFARALSGER